MMVTATKTIRRKQVNISYAWLSLPDSRYSDPRISCLALILLCFSLTFTSPFTVLREQQFWRAKRVMMWWWCGDDVCFPTGRVCLSIQEGGVWVDVKPVAVSSRSANLSDLSWLSYMTDDTLFTDTHALLFLLFLLLFLTYNTLHYTLSGDSYGNKKGSYGYTDAHGIYRKVDYIADEHGFRAKISTNEPGTESADPANVSQNPADFTHESLTQCTLSLVRFTSTPNLFIIRLFMRLLHTMNPFTPNIQCIMSHTTTIITTDIMDMLMPTLDIMNMAMSQLIIIMSRIITVPIRMPLNDTTLCWLLQRHISISRRRNETRCYSN